MYIYIYIYIYIVYIAYIYIYIVYIYIYILKSLSNVFHKKIITKTHLFIKIISRSLQKLCKYIIFIYI